MIMTIFLLTKLHVHTQVLRGNEGIEFFRHSGYYLAEELDMEINTKRDLH